MILTLSLWTAAAAATTSCSSSGHPYDAAHNDLTEAFASRQYFYIGGQYINYTLPTSNTTSRYMVGQIYVEHLIPPKITKTNPVVLIHGNAQSGTNFLNTPDGREGWASYLLRTGYEVYITDQAARGRSPYLPGHDGDLTAFSAQQIESQFTAPEKRDPLPYPQAAGHTQWPGEGTVGDPIFDDFYASQVPALINGTIQAYYNNASYTALLQRIGRPSFVFTHSQSGPWGFQLADTVPHLVQGLVSMEPQGPPFQNWIGTPFAQGYTTTGGSRRYGLTNLPLHYDPPLEHDDASLLRTEIVLARDSDSSDCSRQAEPARQLAHLAQVPHLVLTGEASYHAVYDYCTVNYMKQAGLEVDFVSLGDVGIHGNGHFLFLEKNSLEILENVALPWLEARSKL
ncbi:hypothetical protein CKM354_000404200 [Cercospora kikuchii]|uniref:AB hydrolase-1 domain-containing protein n=1 Tax=Cercospora kikuchii TaxID=84275 RepID=A0A9P3CD42_9PEZI|nr:uncharacterized protein CKM354_000404200 [Cercospora kikuchii]GIZ40714.1 hypothetical protein CKM354_000404200 [Cercospora kikuchii]